MWFVVWAWIGPSDWDGTPLSRRPQQLQAAWSTHQHLSAAIWCASWGRKNNMHSTSLQQADPIAILILVAANGFTHDIAPVACLLSRDPDLWSYLSQGYMNSVGCSWLHAASALGHAGRVKFLCAVGSPVNAPATDRSISPLHLAVQHGHAAIVSQLLASGADVRARSCLGQTVLHVLAACPILLAPTMIDMLCAAGADVNATDAAGLSPLHCFFEGPNKRDHDLLRCFLRNGCCAASRDPLGRSPLHTMIRFWMRRGDPYRGWLDDDCAASNIALLIKHGADVNARDNADYTPLSYALRNSGVVGRLPAALLSSGASLD